MAEREGFRTLGALRLTRSPGVRVRPDYATSPIALTGFLPASVQDYTTSNALNFSNAGIKKGRFSPIYPTEG